MVKNKFYGGFTLIEMVVVMGILILLMAIGIGAGRAALNNAADTAHQASVKQIYEAAMAYYAKNGAFPAIGACGKTTANNFSCLLGTNGPLGEYIESFDGGNDTAYYYITDPNRQYVIVCASIGGVSSDSSQNPRGMVCEGNGFNEIVISEADLSSEELNLIGVVNAQASTNNPPPDNSTESKTDSKPTNTVTKKKFDSSSSSYKAVKACAINCFTSKYLGKSWQSENQLF